MSRSRLVLVDADGLLYLAAAIGETVEYDAILENDDGEIYELTFPSAAEVKQHVRDTGHHLHERSKRIITGPVSHCLQVAKRKMEEIRQRYGGTMQVFVKGDGTNWRDDVATLHPYKGNRTNEKPIHLDAVREYMIDRWNAIPISGKEADDEVATRAFEASTNDVVICSPDKDLDQIPGLHWNYKKLVEYEISQEEANAFFWCQVLGGDVADNIKGCWQVGEVAAEELVYNALADGYTDEQMWELVVQQYEESMGKTNCPYAGMPAELVALENARLVWMQTEHGRLWTPPGQPKEYLEGSWDE